MSDTICKENATLQILRQWDKMSTYEQLDAVAVFDRVIEANKGRTVVSLDTETTGLDIVTAKCLGYSFSFEPHIAYWVPIKADPKMKHLAQLLADKTVVFFNAGYDLAIIEKYGVKLKTEQIRDMMIACFFRDIQGYHTKAGLKTQAKEILHLSTVELKAIIQANMGVDKVTDKDIDFTLLEPWQQRVYGCQDADITLMLWQDKSVQKAIELMPEIWELEHKIIPAVMEMHRNGIKVDVERCIEFDNILETACRELSAQASEIATDYIETNKHDLSAEAVAEYERLTGKAGLNLGSYKQKQALLYGIMGLPTAQRTKTGYSTDKRALGMIADRHPIALAALKYGSLVSRRNGYTKKLPSLVNPVTGRIHPSLWATGARSGRFSCSHPNLQGVSTDRSKDDVVHLRELFIAEPGNCLTAADYSQMELRIAASASQEPTLCTAYNDANADVHAQVAAQIYKVPIDKVTPNMRNSAKVANFSILFGMSAKKFYATHCDVITNVEEAQEVIEGWFAAMPVLTRWIAATKQRAHANRFAKTYFGRVLPLPEICRPSETTLIPYYEVVDTYTRYPGDDFEQRRRSMAVSACIQHAERRAVSHYVQGTAADLVKIALVKTHNIIQKEKMPVKMLLQVHDELLFEHPESMADEVAGVLKETMTFDKVGPGWVPMPVDVGHGKTWAEAH